MNRVQIRDAVVAEFESMWSHADVKVFYENAVTIDLNEAGDTILILLVEFSAARQINISETPDTRLSGFVDIHILTRETKGTRHVLGYCDELSSYFSYRRIGGLHLGVAEDEKKKPPAGWFAQALSIPFFADSNA